MACFDNVLTYLLLLISASGHITTIILLCVALRYTLVEYLISFFRVGACLGRDTAA